MRSFLVHTGCGHNAVPRAPLTSTLGFAAASVALADTASQHQPCGSDARPHRQCCLKVLQRVERLRDVIRPARDPQQAEASVEYLFIVSTEPGNCSLEPIQVS